MNAKGKKSKHLTAGFSLIELMVVVAIVALLTGIAMPSYKTYLAQSKVTEIFSLASDQMNQFVTAYNAGTSTTTCNSSLGTYVNAALINPTSSTTISACGGATGQITSSNNMTKGVTIGLNATAGTNIDSTLSGVILWFKPNTQGSTTGDTSNYNWSWSCLVNTNNSTALSLLAPGNCTYSASVPAAGTL